MRLRKSRLNRTPLPSIIMSNVQSLRSKIDDLQAMVRFQHDYKDACILALTETWLKSSDPGNSVIIDGFGIPFRTDRCPRVTGKSKEVVFAYILITNGAVLLL